MAKGDDSRGRQAQLSGNQRYIQQQGPMVSSFAENYGRGSEANYGDYTDIMNRYRSIADGGGGVGGGVGGGGASMSASHIGYKDPFNSYGGFSNFSETGGYSAEDMDNLRARAASPIRAAYSNAEREVQRQRSLQGGYAPNMIATMAKMARERGQEGSDATINAEGSIVNDRNKFKLAGLSGMSNIEGQRLQADLDVARFNAQADMAASASSASASNSAAAQSNADRFRSLAGMTDLYGTTPGMSNTFGNQLLQGVGQGGNFTLGMLGAQNQNAQLPGDWDYFTQRAGQVGNMLYPWMQP